MTKKTDTPTFEESLTTLEALIEKLESPETPLEVIVQTYAEGQKLLKACQKRLEEAELILEKANKDGSTEKID